ncbi:NERD domain-containing protein [Jeotgalibaca sp. MA1X17-3]|uniref:nuclease-related domain-containing protein n=1 Tax=Jeotgalibaca sp. MA1X17-3 TaxID=2908211 RepID=UPI001F398324|nr:nuclease-related domain-containing protein [Jeotgalibaca sp. MA1X17-3]UJF15232.1 NERD domain-containing protein [Jeotgalibaca sp. MA1X17-3]
MIYKARVKSKSITILECLAGRMQFSQSDYWKYHNQKKGFEGEQLLDTMLENLECDCLILNDLELPYNSSSFQIDSLIITAFKIYLLEVKNYEGDFFMEGKDLYQKPNYLRSNPELYLERKQDYLTRVLQEKGCSYPIESKVLYIHNEFTLLQAPLVSSILLPTQIPAYLRNLSTISSKISTAHKKLANTLLEMHLEDNGKRNIPVFTYDDLQKGILCPQCSSPAIHIKQKYCSCANCGYQSTNTQELIRCIDEFRLLFPDKKVTTQAIYLWCAKMFSKKSIQRVLTRYYQVKGATKGAYYQ